MFSDICKCLKELLRCRNTFVFALQNLAIMINLKNSISKPCHHHMQFLGMSRGTQNIWSIFINRVKIIKSVKAALRVISESSNHSSEVDKINRKTVILSPVSTNCSIRLILITHNLF